MTAPHCRCGNPLHNQMTICGGCAHRLRTTLRNQGEFEAQLETELARQSVKQPRSDGGRSFDHPLPYSEQAGLLLFEQRNLLVSWSKLIVEEYGCDWPEDRIPPMARFLAHQIKTIQNHAAAPDLVAEFGMLRGRIIKLIDSLENRTRIDVGPCFAEYPEGICPGQMIAIVPADEEIPPVMRCSVCRIEYRSDQWVRAGAKINQRAAQLRDQMTMATALSGARKIA